jgi:hypothetical protein
LESVLGKTLGAVDKNKVFERTVINSKITGIAGDVVEQSIIGMPRDNNQRPDLNVDGTEIELKSTGIRLTKKNPKAFEAKEPMSITAVSPKKIVCEKFYDSKFWHKLDYMLLIFYHYDSTVTVKAADYADFYIKGYRFNRFSETDEKILKADWKIVRKFIKDLHENYDYPEKQYPRLSSELRSELVYIDTAPKWPNHPRFRLKRQFVSSIVQEHFGDRLEQLHLSINTYSDLDKQLQNITKKFKGKTIKELMDYFSIDNQAIDKSIAERIVVKMFGGESKKIGQIEFFNKANISVKTITLTKEGGRTEDMKILPVNFDEIRDSNLKFKESDIFDYFMNKQMICIIFEEESSESPLSSNKFIGFKRLSYSDEFIKENVKATWKRIRHLVNNNKLVESIDYDKKGNIRKNKNGVIKKSVNFPKAKKYIVFVRGTGTDSSVKPCNINGIKMYHQDYWIKGKYIVDVLSEIPFI